MTRQTQAITILITLLSFYALLYLDLLPIPIDRSIIDQIIPCLPFNAIITIASYCLCTLGYGVYTFGECEEAYSELMLEISAAKDDLRSKGVSVD